MILPGGAGSTLSFLLGLIFGSFANVCIHRVPQGSSVVAPRSRCPSCGALIAWYDNIPVVSWIALRARCRRCGAGISWTYPVVELAMGLGFAGLYLKLGPGLEALAGGWLFFTCVVLWGIDSRHFILPDVLTLTGLVAGFLFAAARGLLRLPGAGEASASALFLGGMLDQPPLILAAMAGAASGAAIPLVARSGYMISRRLGRRERSGQVPEKSHAGEPPGGEAEPAEARGSDAGADILDGVAQAAREEGMGLGDVKMLAMVGAFLGPQPVLVTILAGSITGCLVVIPWLLATRRGFRTPIPFGPFLAFGAMVALLAGEELTAGYSRLILHLVS